MPNAVEELLNSLDHVITQLDLDTGDVREPVTVGRLLEAAETCFAGLPSQVLGISTQWNGRAGISFNEELREPGRTHDYRYTCAHEFGHLHQRHCGQFVLFSTEGEDPSKYDKAGGHYRKWLERQADYAAAYLLVRRSSLEALRDQEPTYIASLLDVPVYLVELRWHIWRKFGR
jgi:hypothetical protein